MSFLKRLFLTLLLLASTQLIAQDEATENEEENTSKYDLKKLLRPEIGIGGGIMTFLGDVGFNQITQPLQNRFGFHGYLTYHLTDAFDANISLQQGNIYGSREVQSGNNFARINFHSFIRVAQLTFSYNFRNFYKNNDFKVNPYIFAGVEAIWFSTRIDRKNGNSVYNFWSDGSIRSIPETDANIILADQDQTNNGFIIPFDNSYETHAKGNNVLNAGDYPTIVLGVPAGFGFNLKLSKNMSAKFAGTINFTYSDLIDVKNSEIFSIYKGNELNDIFIYTHGTLAYDFGAKSDDEDQYEGVDYLALGEEDTDGDGVKDFDDACADTPSDAIVDEKGCPLDEDEDGVADYKDDELDTELNAFVDTKGVTLSEDELANRFNVYMDSTGKYIPTSMLNAGRKDYKVQILEGAIPEDQLEQFLSLNDLETRVLPDGTQKHTVGIYTTREQAEERAVEMKQQGFTQAQVIEESFEPERIITSFAHKPANYGYGVSASPDDDGGVLVHDGSKGSVTVGPDGKAIPTGIPNEPGVIYRIQIGAFSQPVPSSAFKGVPVIATPAGNGITRYLTGNFKNYQAATDRKNILLDNGFDGAFVVAYKDGKKISLSGAQKSSGNSSGNTPAPSSEYSDDVRYRVQIGAYKGTPPSNVIGSATNLSKETLDNGITRYFSGNFNSYNEAVVHSQQLENKGIQGSFVSAYKTGNKISFKQNNNPNTTNSNDLNFDTKDNSTSIIDPNTIVFKIQLGLYQNAIPNSELSKFLVIKNIKAEQTLEGATRYTAGSFNNINDARNYKEEIERKGISGTFIIAFTEGNQIPLEDAINAVR